MSGVFVTFEGGEGAGKSTQVDRLARTLRTEGGRRVIATREPGGTTRAEAIRKALLSGVAKPYGPFAEALLFCAARIDHLDMLIRPALAQDVVVLCDRFSDSTSAYQGAAGGLDGRSLAALDRITVGETRPDLTLILDLPPEIGLARAKARAAPTGGEPDRFESEALDFHARLRAAFLAIAEAEPERCVVIDAARDAEAVEADIRGVVAARLPALLPALPRSSDTRDDAA